jgi:hypothetical protein
VAAVCRSSAGARGYCGENELDSVDTKTISLREFAGKERGQRGFYRRSQLGRGARVCGVENGSHGGGARRVRAGLLARGCS